VKFIKQVAAEYDFNIAATKAMFSNFERNNAMILFLPILLTCLDQATFEKLFYCFRKKYINEDGMMIIEHSKYQTRPYDSLFFQEKLWWFNF
jgi:hypothetical protein